MILKNDTTMKRKDYMTPIWAALLMAALMITACSSNDDIAVDDEPQVVLAF